MPEKEKNKTQKKNKKKRAKKKDQRKNKKSKTRFFVTIIFRHIRNAQEKINIIRKGKVIT